MSGSVVTFDYAAWSALFPDLACGPLTEAQATLCFGLAQSYVDNACTTTIMNTATLTNALNLATAHIAVIMFPTVFYGGKALPASPLVGRISNATQGSISAQVEMPENPNAGWWQQTKYGAMVWQMLAPYRTAFYLAASQIPLAAQSYPGPFFLGGGGFPWRR